MERELDFVDECYKDKDLSLLKKLTLVVPTYNRELYLSRCLWYHAHFPFEQIIIADSSTEDIKTINRKTAQKISKTFERNIVYLEYPPERETYGGDIYRKWWDAMAHSKTEYTQFCTDKEFIIPTVSCMGIKYLTENYEYICAFGNRLEYIKSIVTKKYVAPCCIQSYDETHAIDRLNKVIKYPNNPENAFHVYHSNIKKLLNQSIIDCNIDDLRYGEIAVELGPLVRGKIKQFRTPGRVRDLLSSRTGMLQKVNKNESSSIRYPSLLDYPKSRKEQLHNQLIKYFSKIKLETDTSDINEIDKITKIIIERLMGNRLDKVSTRCKYFISKQLPDPIKKILAHIKKTTFTESPDKKTVKKELMIIKKIILEYEYSIDDDFN